MEEITKEQVLDNLPKTNNLLGLGLEYATHKDKLQFILDRNFVRDILEEALFLSKEIWKLKQELKKI